jgi:hypothetical protein
VAGVTGSWEQLRLLGMIRIGGVVVIGLMAANAGCRPQVVIVVDVAVGAGAGRYRVAASQYEPGQGVIERGVCPTVGGMAALARLRGKNRRCSVLRIRRAVEIFRVAADALRRHVVERGECSTLMAIVAGRGGVRTGQREPVHVHVDLSDRNLPAANGVTAVAGGGHFAAVNIGMAAGALVADVGEHHFRMTIDAVNVLVQAAQRKFRLVVVELRHRANRLPAVDGVAVLARDIQIAVGAARLLCRLRRGSASNGRRQQQPQDHPFSDQTWNQFFPPHVQDS